MNEKLGEGAYSVEIGVIEFRRKTFIVGYEKDVDEAYALVEERIADGTLEMNDGDASDFEIEIIS